MHDEYFCDPGQDIQFIHEPATIRLHSGRDGIAESDRSGPLFSNRYFEE